MDTEVIRSYDTVLELWFRRRLREWWMSMRWLAITLICLAAIDVLHSILNTAFHSYFRANKAALIHEPWVRAWIGSYRPLKYIEPAVEWILCCGALLLIFTAAGALRPTDEMRVGLSDTEMQSSLRRVMYRTVYRWTLWLVLLPPAIGYVASFFLPELIPRQWSHQYLLALISIVGLWLLVSELGYFASAKALQEQGWLYVGAAVVFIALLEFLQFIYPALVWRFYSSFDFARGPTAGDVSLQLAPYVAVLVAALLLRAYNRRLDLNPAT
jgi:hypothetical protein